MCMWQQWINLILGIWVIAMPFALGLSNDQNSLWTMIVTGIVIAGLALWGALEEQSPGHERELRHRTT